METTTNYKLPQWVKADQIKMDDFNGAFADIDAALKSHDDTLNTKADTSAVTAVQQEVAAAREANCLVKLAGPLVTTAADAAMEFDLSQVDMTKVAALFLTFSASSVSGTMSVSVNNASVGTICSNDRSTSAGVAWLFPFGGKVASYTFSACNVGGLTNYSDTTESVNWTGVTSVKLSGGSNAGATATLFAIKK